MLIHNATTNDTSENGTRSFGVEHSTRHPSPRTVRYRLGGLKLAEIGYALQEGNEKILSLAQKQRIFENPVPVSIDITHTPCYGKKKKYACGTKKFKGTKYGYRYASVVVSMNGIGFTLHTVCMTQFTRKTEILKKLIEKAQKYVKIKILLVDRGFFNIPCIKKLEELNITYLMPVIKHNKKFLRSLQPPCKKEMPMGPKKNRIYFTVVAVRSPKDPSKILYYATNKDIPETSLENVINTYKKRWTIENTFKSQKLAFLAKTYSVYYLKKSKYRESLDLCQHLGAPFPL